MTITAQTTILGPVESSVEQVMAYVGSMAERKVDVELYVREIFRLAPLVSLRPLVLCAQACHETNLFRSTWFVERLNVAGLGITGDPAQNEESHTWANGTDSARAQIVHMWQYTHEDRSLPTELFHYQNLDPRLGALRESGFAGTVRVVADLTGKWATDPAYHDGICRHANAILAANGGSMTTAPLLPSAITQRFVLDSQNSAWDNLGQRVVRGFVLHRMLGSLDGTDIYFRGMANAQQTRSGGLTDYGQHHIGGQVYQWNDPLGAAHGGCSPNRAGWASGVYNVNGDAYGDGAAVVNRWGINVVNAGLVSWEISGFYGDPWSDAAMHVAAAACAHYAHAYGLSWETFPAIPAEANRSFVIWHQELTGPSEKICPGPVVMGQTDAFIALTTAKLKAAQTGTKPPAPPKYAKRHPIPDPWQTKEIGGRLYIKHGEIVTAAETVPVLEYADPHAKPVDAPLPKGKRVRVAYVCAGSDGELYYISTGGARMVAAAFTQ